MFLTEGGGELLLGRWFAIYWLIAIIFNWVLTLGEESVCVEVTSGDSQLALTLHPPAPRALSPKPG